VGALTGEAKCELCGAVNRTAQVTAMLRHVILELHQQDGPGHQFAYWTLCPHPTCTKVTDLLHIRRKA
jgi:hypothetical protein